MTGERVNIAELRSIVDDNDYALLDPVGCAALLDVAEAARRVRSTPGGIRIGVVSERMDALEALDDALARLEWGDQ